MQGADEEQEGLVAGLAGTSDLESLEEAAWETCSDTDGEVDSDSEAGGLSGPSGTSVASASQMSSSGRRSKRRMVFEHDAAVETVDEAIYAPASVQRQKKKKKKEEVAWWVTAKPILTKLLALIIVLVALLLVFVVLGLVIGLGTSNDSSAAVPTKPDELPDDFDFFANSTLRVEPKNTTCTYEYSCPLECTPAVNQLLGCCSGCYQGPEGNCGLAMNVSYDHLPPSEGNDKLQHIYLLASNDAKTFWQTGWPVLVTDDRENTLNGTGWAMVNDGCYGQPGSAIVAACLSTYDLTGETFDHFPLAACISYWGICLHLNNVWVAVWVNNYLSSDEFIAAASGLSVSWVQLVPPFLALLAIAVCWV